MLEALPPLLVLLIGVLLGVYIVPRLRTRFGV